MKIIFKNSFLKELKKIKDEKLKNDIYTTIILVEKSENIKQLKSKEISFLFRKRSEGNCGQGEPSQTLCFYSKVN